MTKFADQLAEAVDKEERPNVATTNQMIRSLPVRYEFDITDIEVHDVEIMLVTPSKVVSQLVSTELGACGFRTLVVRDPIESIALAVRMPPGMIIASAVMDGLGGMDLLRGLKAMTPTHKVPMALLTSLDNAVKDVPDGIMVIRVGTHFGDDFAAAITKFNLGEAPSRQSDDWNAHPQRFQSSQSSGIGHRIKRHIDLSIGRQHFDMGTAGSQVKPVRADAQSCKPPGHPLTQDRTRQFLGIQNQPTFPERPPAPRAHSTSVSSLSLASLLKHPNVSQPFRSAGNGVTSGA